MQLRYACLAALAAILVLPATAQVKINEFSASNLTQYLDNYAKAEDWVELYNTTGATVDLTGWWLSDKQTNPQKWQFPAGITIPANGFIRLWCSGRDEVVGTDYHTNFKLSQTKANEVLMLSDASGTVTDLVGLEITLLGHSRARSVDGDPLWKICTSPTLAASNNASPTFSGYTTAPTFNIDAGFFSGTQNIEITTTEPNTEIRYTIDGRLPTATSPLYSGPITVSQTTVVKGRVFSSDPSILPGKITFNTYFINETVNLPIFSVAADLVKNLANGNDNLEPIGSIEYFVDGVRVATSYGELNKHGQDSWVNPHRSIDWVSRDEMGYSGSVQAEIFTYTDRDEYQRIIFRASGDDNYPAINDADHEGSTHIRDEYVHTLAQVGDMSLDVRAVERCLVFLDGEYWGLYAARERPVDHDYTEAHYKQDKYHTYFLATWGNTWAEYGGQPAFDDWIQFRDFILNNDMSDPANYQVVKDNMRVLSLIDYFIANLNSVASDWLNYNTGWWRGTDPNGDHKKWGYVLWDNDATFDYYINYSGVPNTDPDAVPCDIDDISDYMDQFFGGPWGDPDVGKHEKIFLKLQNESPEFKQLYYSRQADLMNTVYSCDVMLGVLDSMLAIIEPEMPRQIARWGGSMAEWQGNVVDLRAFVEERCTLLDNGMVDCFDVTGPYDLTLLVSPVGVGKIDLNTLTIEQFPYEAAYFGGMENLVNAKSVDSNYVFSYWRARNGSVISPDEFTKKAAITLTDADTLIAVFTEANGIVEGAAGFEFNAYPTVVRDRLTVAFEIAEQENITVTLYNTLGVPVAAFPELNGPTAAGSYQHQLNLQSKSLAAGVYLLNFKTADAERTMRVIIAN